ncbi:MAG: hypothetical protein A3B22_02885 [Candidatus Zambryskibacteria bacterium RIFCSPLOWO2_01_FULL_47_33]|nr:MAG: hypothetical protein A3B22_02885 [Candidatus Zambryskibacteria bacterium RIFCSPLOWO2_01_FULL_47_33]
MARFFQRNFNITFFATDADDFASDNVRDINFLDNVPGIYKLAPIDDTGAERRQVNVDRTFINTDDRSLHEVVD